LQEIEEKRFNTPLSSILAVSGFSIFIIFALCYLLIIGRTNSLRSEYDSLEKEGYKSFATLTAYHRVKKFQSDLHVYTYMVADPNGKLHEVDEWVDMNLNSKLRIGDVHEATMKKIYLYGKETIIARLARNRATPPYFTAIKDFTGTGIAFSLIILFLAGIKKISGD
jgi:hypothetical protein